MPITILDFKLGDTFSYPSRTSAGAWTRKHWIIFSIRSSPQKRSAKEPVSDSPLSMESSKAMAGDIQCESEINRGDHVQDLSAGH